MRFFNRKEHEPPKNVIHANIDFSAGPSQKSIIERFADIINGSRVEGDTVVLPNSQASVRLEMFPPEGDSKTPFVALAVWIDHPAWDRTIYDEASGLGQTPDGAIDAALKNVYFNLVHLIDEHGFEAPNERLVTTWAGVEHHWSVWRGYVMALLGHHDSDPREYWNLLGDLLTSRLGNQKVVYVKVYASTFGDDCEVRINDQISFELTHVLRHHVNSAWSGDRGVQKMFFWIVQDEETHQPYPYTAADLYRYVIGAGKMTQQFNHDAVSDEEYDALVQMTGDPSLASELLLLLPEIVASRVIDVPIRDNLVIQCGPASYDLTYHQLACYAHFCEAITSAEEAAKTTSSEQQKLFIQTMQSWLDRSLICNFANAELRSGRTHDDLKHINPIVNHLDFGDSYQLR